MLNNCCGNVHDIRNYGAVADGKTLCTDAFRKAIDECAKVGGGTVFVPAGTFLTGEIHLKSNITLYVESGAVIKFSQNVEDYSVLTARWEGAECKTYSPLIYGENIENVTITGRGTLDGQGASWWKIFKDKTIKYPRPRFIGFTKCKDIIIEGIKLLDSPSWTINPVMCENIVVDKVSLKNPADSPNTDGINPESCKNVRISNCHIDVGDDCVTIKSGTEASVDKVACENITVTNCTMVHGHGGVVIGSEMSGGVKNVVISNCVFEGTDRGIRLKSRRDRGGCVEDIRVTNIVMKGVIAPLVMHLFYYCGPGGKEAHIGDRAVCPVSDTTPRFRRIHLSNITARDVHAAAGFLFGLPEMPIEEITFDNISISMAENATPGVPAMMAGVGEMVKTGFYCANTKDISFNNIRITGQEGSAFVVEDSKSIDISKCTTDNADRDTSFIKLKNTSKVYISGCRLNNDAKLVETSDMDESEVEIVK